jgi:double-stranded uracil-DNA glycosylase
MDRPTAADLEAARGRGVPDVIAAHLQVLFCGINPSLYSAAVGHHFARPGNRFWKVLHASGFTPGLLPPEDDRRLLELGVGVTNLVARATAAAAELAPEELRLGGERLRRKAARWRPEVVAVVGMGAFRTAFGRPQAVVGEQPEEIGGARSWLLPNPSGLQAHYQMDDLVESFSALRKSL